MLHPIVVHGRPEAVSALRQPTVMGFSQSAECTSCCVVLSLAAACLLSRADGCRAGIHGWWHPG